MSSPGGPGGWNQNVIDEFHANKGWVGGYFEGAPMILVHHIGARPAPNGSIRWSTCPTATT